MSPFLVTLLAVLGLVLVRNAIAYRVGLMRLEEVHAYHTALIDAGHFELIDYGRYDLMPSYPALMFDLTKWTYRQFFPKQIGEPQ